jgi:hypothetical protein
MKTSSLLVASVALFGLVACSSTSTGTSGSSGSPGNPNNPGLPSLTSNGGNGTCDQACSHYLQCKGADWSTAQNQSTCVQNCGTLNATPGQLAEFVTLDCATAISVIETPPNGGSSGGNTSSGNTSGSSTDCNGCVWDGGSCIYLTGSGGNYFACASSCCPGH